MTYVIAALVAYCLVREIVYLYSMQVMINKLMSRSYADYSHSQKPVTLPKDNKPLPGFEDEPEDLGALDEIV